MSFDFQSELYQRRQNTFDGAGNLIGCRFDADNGKVSQMNHARHYVQHWQKMREKGIGLLFWGPPGTGKTYAAACIANAFVESKEDFAPSVIMTTFGCILRRMLACGPQEREEYFDRLLNEDPDFAVVLNKTKQDMENGKSFSSAVFDNKIFSGIYSRMLSIGQKTGCMDQVMGRIADMYQTEIDARTSNRLAVIEPLLVIVMSVVIGAIMLSVMFPLLGLMSSM